VGKNNDYATGVPGCNVAYTDRGYALLKKYFNLFSTNISQCHTGVIFLYELNEGLLIFDSMVFALTILKTYHGRYQHHFTSWRWFDIIFLILQDGMSIIEQPVLQ
jgi:hypothetical protein